jgi:hypothetical protein
MPKAALSFDHRNEKLTALALEQRVLLSDLLKLRTVMFFLDLPHGCKVAKSATLVNGLKNRGLKASLRSLYVWRERYLRSGFAGLVRWRRRDRGRPHSFGDDVLLRIVDVAARVRSYGDVRREYASFQSAMCYETFRAWVRRAQKRLRLVEMPMKEERIGLIF